MLKVRISAELCTLSKAANTISGFRHRIRVNRLRKLNIILTTLKRSAHAALIAGSGSSSQYFSLSKHWRRFLSLCHSGILRKYVCQIITVEIAFHSSWFMQLQPLFDPSERSVLGRDTMNDT